MSFWSAHDLPMISLYIYRAPPAKCAKNFVLVNFFRFSKNREKSQKTQRKSGFLCHFLLIKTAFFLKRSSQKCIIKTIISYTTNAQLFLWKTVRKCLRTNVIHLFFKCFGIFCFDFDKRKLYEYFRHSKRAISYLVKSLRAGSARARRASPTCQCIKHVRRQHGAG